MCICHLTCVDIDIDILYSAILEHENTMNKLENALALQYVQTIQFTVKLTLISYLWMYISRWNYTEITIILNMIIIKNQKKKFIIAMLTNNHTHLSHIFVLFTQYTLATSYIHNHTRARVLGYEGIMESACKHQHTHMCLYTPATICRLSLKRQYIHIKTHTH